MYFLHIYTHTHIYEFIFLDIYTALPIPHSPRHMKPSQLFRACNGTCPGLLASQLQSFSLYCCQIILPKWMALILPGPERVLLYLQKTTPTPTGDIQGSPVGASSSWGHIKSPATR